MPRQHTDCLNSINKIWSLYRRDLCPLVIRARGNKGHVAIRALNSDEISKLCACLTTKNPLLAKFFV